MNESDYKTDCVRRIRKAGGYGRRIEDKYGVGFPDMLIKLPEFEACLIEAKIVKGRYFSPTARQYLELVEWEKAGGIGIVLGYDPLLKIHFLSPPTQDVDTRDCVKIDAPFPIALEEYLHAHRT